MGSLQIVLRNGFSDDAVRVIVNGRTVLDEPRVTTRTQVEVAAMRQVDIEGGSADVTISVPTRQLSSSLTLSLAATASLEISLTADGGIEHRTSRETVRVM